MAEHYELGPHRSQGLVDVLDRILDKGLMIAGDIRIRLADVELLTIQIRLLVCSVDKAEEIGMNWWKTDPRLSTEARDLMAGGDLGEIRPHSTAVDHGDHPRARGGDRGTHPRAVLQRLQQVGIAGLLGEVERRGVVEAQPGLALEQPAEEGRILIADFPADLVGGRVRAFEPSLRVLDPEALDVIDWRKAGRLREAPLESALGETRAPHHLLHGARNGEVLREPRLGIRDRGITMILAALEHDIGREAVVMPLECEAPRYRLRRRRADVCAWAGAPAFVGG